jgi:tetratricopeptide (TPR) repeat protein
MKENIIEMPTGEKRERILDKIKRKRSNVIKMPSRVEISQQHLDDLFKEALELDQSGYDTEAINAYKSILDIHSGYISALCNLGVIYMRINEYDKALDCFLKTVNLKKDYEKGWFSLGFCFDQLKQFHKSELAYKKAIELNPNNYNAYFNLAGVHIQTGENDLAKQCYIEYLRLSPQDDNDRDVAESQIKKLSR